MEVTKTLKPGDRGTTRLLREYGDRLVCVRYRFDHERNKHVTTVEIVVDERSAIEEHTTSSNQTPISQESVVVRIDFHETELREKAKQANGIWDPQRRGWLLPCTRRCVGWDWKDVSSRNLFLDVGTELFRGVHKYFNSNICDS